jgi:hypothetical protein
MTTQEKRKAALDAIEEYQLYAATNAVVIANDAVALLKASGHSAWAYPELSRYIQLRDEADRLRKEIES